MAQARACFARNDPSWNCKKWAKETDFSRLPERKVYTGPKGGKYVKKGSEKVYTGEGRKAHGRKIYTGPKGGKYIRRNGRKVYL